MSTTTTSNAQRQSMEDIALLQDGIDSLTAMHHSSNSAAASHAEPAAAGADETKRPLLHEAGTIVTTGDDLSNDNNNEYYHDNDGLDCDEGFRLNSASDFEISEVIVNNNDGQHDQDSDEDPNESEDEETMDASDDEDSDIEEEEEDVSDESSVESGSSGEYETDGGDELMDDSDDTSFCTAASQSSQRSDVSQHDLFLPWDCSPSTELLKYDSDDESSDSDSDEEDGYYHHNQNPTRRPYMLQGRNGRPRMWDGSSCPSGVSVSSNSSSSLTSQESNKKNKRKEPSSTPSKAGVTFSNSVTVYPVFETTVYTPTMVESMYTKRDELRLNKMRNKKEYQYDCFDWRNATEEDEMEEHEDTGDLIHPVHCCEPIKASVVVPSSSSSSAAVGSNGPKTRNGVQTYSSTMGGGMVHRAKRMRMYYP